MLNITNSHNDDVTTTTHSLLALVFPTLRRPFVLEELYVYEGVILGDIFKYLLFAGFH